MGIQELLYGVGALALLAALAYGVSRSGRKRETPEQVKATRRNFDKV